MKYCAEDCDRHLAIRHEHSNYSCAFGRFAGASAVQEFVVLLAKTPIVSEVRSDGSAKIPPPHLKSSNRLSFIVD